MKSNPSRSRALWSAWLAIALAVLLAPPPSRADDHCLHSDIDPATAQHRRERLQTFDVQHIRAELTLEPAYRTIRGRVTHVIRPVVPHLREFELDCGDLTIERVTVSPSPSMGEGASGAEEGPGDAPAASDASGDDAAASNAPRPQPSSTRGEEEEAPSPTGGEGEVSFDVEAPVLHITLERGYTPDETFAITIEYEGRPAQGMYFILPSEAYRNTPLTIWTQGEPEDTQFWLPCYDYPNDFATSEMIVTVPQPLTAVSNGVLQSRSENSEAGTTTFHWRMDVPHVSYLISIVAGELVCFEAEVDGLPLEYWVPARDADALMIERVFGRTPEMIRFFNQYLDTPYPYPRYAQVVAYDYTGGGMEHITATTLTYRTVRDERAGLEGNSDGLIAHELAHQWWGDLVTCRDWRYIWLNEGFATYFDALFVAHDRGVDAFHWQMLEHQRSAAASGDVHRNPVIWDGYGNDGDIFSYPRVYQKGACVLHMLRGLLGDQAFRIACRQYLHDFRHQPVTVEDFARVVERTSEQELDWFFDQWLRRPGAPRLVAEWEWIEEDMLARVTVRQELAGDSDGREAQPEEDRDSDAPPADGESEEPEPIFRLPTEIAFTFPSEAGLAAGNLADGAPAADARELSCGAQQDGATAADPESDGAPSADVGPAQHSFSITIDRAEQTFYFSLPERPAMVRIDPGGWLLAQQEWTKPVEEWLYQLAHASDVGGRSQAIAALRETEPAPEIEAALIARLSEEPFWPLRRELVQALAEFDGEAVEAALLAASRDEDARVRAAAYERLREFSSNAVQVRLREAWASEPGYGARAAALRALCAQQPDDLFDLIEAALDEPSYEEIIARTAVDLLGEHEHPRRRELWLLCCAEGQPRHVRCAACGRLGRIAAGDAAVIDCLGAMLEDPNLFVRDAAFGALREAKDQAALPHLERLLEGDLPRDTRSDIERLIEELRQSPSESERMEAAERAAELEAEAAELERRARLLRLEAERVRVAAGVD